MRKTATFAVVTLFLINILNFYDRNVAGAVVEPMRREFVLNDFQIGLLTTAMTVLYAIIGVPIGRVADLWSRRRLLALGVTIWSALTAMSYFASNYGFLLFTRLGVGVGEATCAPTATSWLGDLVPPTRRARVLALFMLGVPVGGALSYFFSGAITRAITQSYGAHYGWRVAMVVAAAPAVLLIPALLALKEPRRGESEQLAHASAPGSMWVVLRIPTLWWIIASGALVNFNMYTIGTFMPAMFGRTYRMDVRAAGIETGIVYLIGGVLGGFLGGWFGDRVIRTRKNGRLLYGSLFAVLGVPFAFLASQAPALTIAVVYWTITYASLNTYYGLVYSSIQDIVAPAQRGATMALYFMAMYLCGASFGSIITGGLSDHYARVAAQAAGKIAIDDAARALGLQQAMIVIPLVSIALAFVLFMGSRTIIRDIGRREQAAAVAGVA